MVDPTYPCCPLSFGAMGLLGAVMNTRSSAFKLLSSDKGFHRAAEEENLLDVDEAACDELTDDRISRFLDIQKEQYYRSIGLVPPKQMRSMDIITTPGESLLEISSTRETSRETSLLDESGHLILPSSPAAGSQSDTPLPQTFRMDDSEDDSSKARQSESQTQPVESRNSGLEPALSTNEPTCETVILLATISSGPEKTDARCDSRNLGREGACAGDFDASQRGSIFGDELSPSTRPV
jgi:hypothetical protein